MSDQTLDLIRQKEGYSSKAYWDVTAWRIGYGSDTMTDAAGNVVPVTKNSVTTRADAERDLARRVPEFQKSGVIKYVGKDAWDKLSPAAKAAITSVAYNYGSLSGLPSLVAAVQTGDPASISKAIADRGADNGGVNKERRSAEAALVLNGGSAAAEDFTAEGKPIDPKTGFLMDKADPRYEAAMTRVAPGSPKPMPQSAASAARARAADIAKRTGGLSPTERAEARAGLSGGMSPAARDEARAPVAAPARPVATGGLSPDARDEARAAMLKPTKLNNEKPVVAPAPMDGVGPGATFKGVQAFAASGKPAAVSGGYKTTGAVAGSVQMPSGARPSSVPAPVKTGGKSPTERDEAKAASSPKPATIAGPAGMKPLAAPAPLKTGVGSPSYKNVSVLNPAYDEWAKKYGDGSQIQTAATGGMITKNQLAAIQSTGGVPKPAAVSVPKAPPKYIQKRIAVPGAAARPVQRPSPAVAPKVSIAAQQAASIAKQERDNAMGAGGNAEDRRAYQQQQHDQAMYGNITRSLV